MALYYYPIFNISINFTFRILVFGKGWKRGLRNPQFFVFVYVAVLIHWAWEELRGRELEALWALLLKLESISCFNFKSSYVKYWIIIQCHWNVFRHIFNRAQHTCRWEFDFCQQFEWNKVQSYGVTWKFLVVNCKQSPKIELCILHETI